MKVWFNGNKDIFFLKYFEYDIRPLYERYIIWYYDNIEWYIRKLISEPFLRMIVVPTIIRNLLINSSFFLILKERILMFLFISILVVTGVYEYLHQPWYVWLIQIYIFFLVIWPKIIKKLNVSNFFEVGSICFAYTTPLTIYSTFLLASNKSISLNLYDQFIFFLKVEKIFKNVQLLRVYFLKSWYRYFFLIDLFNIDGLVDYVENDRKFSAIMFWRYEKTYTSFICFWILLLSSFRANLTYYYALDIGFYGSYFKEEEIEEMKKYLELYISLFFKLFVFSIRFLNYTREDWIFYLIGRIQFEEFLKGNKMNDIEDIGNIYSYLHPSWIVKDFYYRKQLIIQKQNIIVKFSSIKNYYSIIKYTSFFYFFESNQYIDKFIYWMIIFEECLNEEINKNVKKNRNNCLVDKINDVFYYKWNENILFPYEIAWYESVIEKTNLMGKNELLENIKEDINELLKK